MIWLPIIVAAGLWLFVAVKALRAHRLQQTQREHAIGTRNDNQDHFNRVVWERLTAAQRVTEILLCERGLGELAARVAAAAHLLEDYVTPAANLGAWRDAAASWLANVALILPDIADDIIPPDPSAMRRARIALPSHLNLSSPDLNAVIAYHIEREQFDTARRRFAQQRDAIIAAYADSRSLR